jgi:hypothetical protein
LDPDNEDQLAGWIGQEGDQALVVWPEVQHPGKPEPTQLHQIQPV